MRSTAQSKLNRRINDRIRRNSRGLRQRGKKARVEKLEDRHLLATDVLLGSITEISGPDDLKLDPPNVVTAVNFTSQGEDRTVGGVLFRDDQDPVLAGQGISFVLPQTVPNWKTIPELGATADHNELEQILWDIRWSNNPNVLEAHVPVTPGEHYRLQILINDNGQETRRWDIQVEGQNAVDELSSMGIEAAGLVSYNRHSSSMYTYSYTATDNSLDVTMGNLFGNFIAADRNAIWQALIVTQIDPPATAALDGDTDTYTPGAPAISLENGGDAVLIDADPTSYEGGSLTVDIGVGAEAAIDTLAISGETTESNFAYEVPAGTVGNQGHTGGLGLDFITKTEIVVDQLGVFDSASDGLANPLTAYIIDRDTGAVVASEVFPAGTGDTLVGGNRFRTLGTPVTLPAGFNGSIVAHGFSGADLNGNVGAPAWTMNDGDSAISFVGGGRWDNGTVSDLPVNLDGGPANRYAAGTFRFTTRRAIVGGTDIGHINGGTNGDALVVDFNQNATVANVDMLLDQVEFSTGAGATVPVRGFDWTISDGDLETSAATTLTLALPPSPETYEWNGSNGTAWNDPLNWTPLAGAPAGVVPDSDDTAQFNGAGQGPVFLGGGTVIVGEVEVNSGSYTIGGGAGDVLFADTVDVNGGVLDLPGTTNIFAALNTIDINDGELRAAAEGPDFALGDAAINVNDNGILTIYPASPPPLGGVTSGLQVWYDASDLDGDGIEDTVDANVFGGPIADGFGVTQWNDKSGNNRNATSSTPGQIPTWDSTDANGRSAVFFRQGLNDFGANDDELNFTDAGNPFRATERYFVFRSPTATWSDYGGIFGKQDGNRGSNFIVERGNTNFHPNQLPANFSRNGVDFGTQGSLAPLTDYMVLRVQVNGNDTAAHPTWVLGDDGTGWSMDMDLAEVIAYQDPLNATDRASLQEYLGIKYGIPIGAASIPPTDLDNVLVIDGTARINAETPGITIASADLGTAGSTLTFNSPSGDVTLSNVSGDGDLVITGNTNFTLDTDNTITGEIRVSSASTLIAGSFSALGTSAGGTTIENGATLVLDGSSGPITVDDALTIGGPGDSGQPGSLVNLTNDNIINGDVTLTGVLEIDSTDGLLTINGNVDMDSSEILVSGAGDVTISGDISNGPASGAPLGGSTTGLQVWYDASDLDGDNILDTVDGDVFGGPIADGFGVTQWNDKSGNNRNAMSSTPGQIPTWQTNEINGLPSVFFRQGTNDGGANDDELNFNDVANPFRAQERYFVFRSPSPTWSDYGGIFGKQDGSRGSNFIFERGQTYFHSNQLPSNVSVDGVDMGNNPSLAPLTDYKILRVEVNGNDTANHSQWVLGDDGTGWSMDMDLAEVVAYQDPLSATDRSNLERFLSIKYGFTTNHRVVMNGSGTLTLSGNNSHEGETIVNSGTLIVDSSATALGDVSTGTIVADGATLGLAGGVNLGAEPLELTGSGAPGQPGALVNISGNNEYSGIPTANGALHIGSVSGELHYSSDLDLGTGDLVVDGPGDVHISGAISGSISVGAANLNNLGALAEGDHSLTADGQTFDAYVDHEGGTGWLLVGRGREGWNWSAAGEGSIHDVNDNLGTPAAFAPTYYSANIINDLMVQSGLDLQDIEIRLRRATDQAGTSYQESRWNHTTELNWRWDFDNSMPVQYDIVSGPFAGLSRLSTTRDLPGHAQNFDRIWTFAWANHGNQRGFNYGSAIAGVNNATSFLWQFASEAHASPYTEVYIRNKNVTGGNSVTMEGEGRLTLSGDNTYIGATNIQGGEVIVANDAALGDTSSGTIVSGGATLTLDNQLLPAGDASGFVELPVAETIDVGGGTIANAAGDNSIAGDVNGSTLSVQPTVIETMSGSLTLSGNLDLGAGELHVRGDADTIITGDITGSLPAGGSGPLGGVTEDLAIWLDASDVDGNGIADGASAGTVVDNWRDKSGWGRDADNVQGSPTTTTGLNGQPVIHFDAGTADLLSTTHNFERDSYVPYSIFTVARYSGGADARIFSSLDITQNWLFGYWSSRIGSWHTNGNWVNFPAPNADTDWDLHTGIITGDYNPLGFMWQNGTLVTANSAFNDISYRPGRLGIGGGFNGGEYSNADVAEVIIYDRTLTDEERLAVESYLSDKYNLGLTAAPGYGGNNLVKSGNGQLTLSGNNDYTGDTRVESGSLIVDSANALGNTGGSTNTHVLDGGSISIQGGLTIENEAFTLNGSGGAAAGALVSAGGNNTIAASSSITAEFASAGNFTISSAVMGDMLMIESPIDLSYSGMTTDGDGDITVNGQIIGGGPTLSEPTVADTVLPMNPILFYDFNDGAGLYTNDESGNESHGILLNNTAFTADGGGISGQPGDYAVDLSAADAGVKVYESLNSFASVTANNAISVSFFQKQNANSAHRSFGTQVDGGPQRTSAHTPWSDGNVYWDTGGCCADPASRTWIPKPTGFDFVNWEHWVFTKDGNTKRIFLNGVQVDLETNATAPIQAITGFTFGNRTDSFSQAFIGLYDNIAVFDYGLSAAEVIAIYNARNDTVDTLSDASLTKMGTGTLELTGSNTYDGGTAVVDGLLNVNNTTGSGTGSGQVTVSANGSLGGDGTIAGSVVIDGGGVIGPGNSPGTLRVNGDLTMAPGSELAIEIETGHGYDQVVVGGSVLLDEVTLSLTTHGTTPVDDYVIINKTGTGTIRGTFANLAEGTALRSMDDSFAFDSISYVGRTGNDVVLRVDALDHNRLDADGKLIVTATSPVEDVLSHWFGVSNSPAYADLNGDGATSIFDLAYATNGRGDSTSFLPNEARQAARIALATRDETALEQREVVTERRAEDRLVDRSLLSADIERQLLEAKRASNSRLQVQSELSSLIDLLADDVDSVWES